MLLFTVHPVGDCALLAGFPQRIAPEIGAAVAELNSRVEFNFHRPEVMSTIVGY